MDAQLKTRNQIDNLKLTKVAYDKHILCGCIDPYLSLIKDKLPIISGPKDSNLFCLVRIKNSGKAALQYRQLANKILFDSIDIQEQMKNNFSDKYPSILFSKNKNPVLIDKNGYSHKTAWHHSPNHILSISLILDSVHRDLKKALHYKGNKGGNSMYSI